MSPKVLHIFNVTRISYRLSVITFLFCSVLYKDIGNHGYKYYIENKFIYLLICIIKHTHSKSFLKNQLWFGLTNVFIIRHINPSNALDFCFFTIKYNIVYRGLVYPTGQPNCTLARLIQEVVKKSNLHIKYPSSLNRWINWSL